MIRRLARLTVLAAGAAVVADTVLHNRRAERPPEPIETLVVIDAPIDAVWRVLSDIPRQPRWMSDLKAVRVVTDGPVGVGTRAEGTVRILGIPISDPIEVTAFEPPTRFAIRHVGSFQGSGTIELEAGVDGTTTLVRWAEILVPPVLPDLAAVLQAPILRRVFQDDLARLKDLVEADAASGQRVGPGTPNARSTAARTPSARPAAGASDPTAEPPDPTTATAPA